MTDYIKYLKDLIQKDKREIEECESLLKIEEEEEKKFRVAVQLRTSEILDISRAQTDTLYTCYLTKEERTVFISRFNPKKLNGVLADLYVKHKTIGDMLI